MQILLGAGGIIPAKIAIIGCVVVLIGVLFLLFLESKRNPQKLLNQLDNYERQLTKVEGRQELIHLISFHFVPFLLHDSSIKPLITDWEKIYLQEITKKDNVYKRTLDSLIYTFQNLCEDLENIYDDDLSRRMGEADALVKGKVKEKSSHPLHWRLNSKLQEIVQLSFDKNLLSNETVRKYAKIENKNGVCRIVEFSLPPSFKETDLMEEKLKWKPENDVYVIWEAFKDILNAKETNYMSKSTDQFERLNENWLFSELNPKTQKDNTFPIVTFTEKFLRSGMQSIINKVRNHHG